MTVEEDEYANNEVCEKETKNCPLTAYTDSVPYWYSN